MSNNILQVPLVRSVTKFPLFTFSFLLCTFVFQHIPHASSHGRLMDPPARNCAWRFGYRNPVNYNDNENYCGGAHVQWGVNGGKCGVCGDRWDMAEPRPHEDGGLYGNGIIVRRYSSGQDIDIEVELTANHMGYFTFKLCNPTGSKKRVTQACFDKNPLYIVSPDGNLTKEFHITHKRAQIKSDTYYLTARLPLYVTCNRCIIQWTYNTGNSWGWCQSGAGQMGCGPQEQFVNCADVSILSNTGSGFGFPSHNTTGSSSSSSSSSSSTSISSSPSHPNNIQPPPVPSHPNDVHPPPTPSPPHPNDVVPSQGHGHDHGHGQSSHYNYTNNPYMVYYRDYSKAGKPIVPLIIRSQVCIGTGLYKNVPGMHDWCQVNCLRYPPSCPKDRCKCLKSCDALPPFNKMRNADQYCLDKCFVYPHHEKCPVNKCKCY